MFRRISGNFNLNAQDDFDIMNTEEVRLSVLSSVEPTTITLPAISDLGALNLKIWVEDIEGNAATNNITIVADTNTPDLINNSASIAIDSDNGVQTISISSKSDWVALAPATGGLLSAQAVLTPAEIADLLNTPVTVIPGVADNVIIPVSIAINRQAGNTYRNVANLEARLLYETTVTDIIALINETVWNAQVEDYVELTTTGRADSVGGEGVLITSLANPDAVGTGNVTVDVLYRLVAVTPAP